MHTSVDTNRPELGAQALCRAEKQEEPANVVRGVPVDEALSRRLAEDHSNGRLANTILGILMLALLSVVLLALFYPAPVEVGL